MRNVQDRFRRHSHCAHRFFCASRAPRLSERRKIRASLWSSGTRPIVTRRWRPRPTTPGWSPRPCRPRASTWSARATSTASRCARRFAISCRGRGGRARYAGLRLSRRPGGPVQRRQLFRSGRRSDQSRRRRADRSDPHVRFHPRSCGDAGKGAHHRARSARANPYAAQGAPLAPGLALVDPEPGELIAFNAAPGTLAGDEEGPYGVYAKTLAGADAAGRRRHRPGVRTRVSGQRGDSRGFAAVQRFQAWRSVRTSSNAPPTLPLPVRRSLDRAPAPIQFVGRGRLCGRARTRHHQGLSRVPRGLPEVGSGATGARHSRRPAGSRLLAPDGRRRYAAGVLGRICTPTRRARTSPTHAAASPCFRPSLSRRRISAGAVRDLPPPPPDERIYEERPIYAFDDFGPPPPPPAERYVYVEDDDWRDLPPPPPPPQIGGTPGAGRRAPARTRRGRLSGLFHRNGIAPHGAPRFRPPPPAPPPLPANIKPQAPPSRQPPPQPPRSRRRCEASPADRTAWPTGRAGGRRSRAIRPWPFRRPRFRLERRTRRPGAAALPAVRVAPGGKPLPASTGAGRPGGRRGKPPAATPSPAAAGAGRPCEPRGSGSEPLPVPPAPGNPAVAVPPAALPAGKTNPPPAPRRCRLIASLRAASPRRRQRAPVAPATGGRPCRGGAAARPPRSSADLTLWRNRLRRLLRLLVRRSRRSMRPRRPGRRACVRFPRLSRARASRCGASRSSSTPAGGPRARSSGCGASRCLVHVPSGPRARSGRCGACRSSSTLPAVHAPAPAAAPPARSSSGHPGGSRARASRCAASRSSSGAPGRPRACSGAIAGLRKARPAALSEIDGPLRPAATNPR